MSTLGRWWPRRVGPAEPLAAALVDHYYTGRPRRVAATRADGQPAIVDESDAEHVGVERDADHLPRLSIDDFDATALGRNGNE